MRLLLSAMLVGILSVFLAGAAHADSIDFGFTHIGDNNSGDGPAIAGDMKLTVTDDGLGAGAGIKFVITHGSLTASAGGVAQVYWDTNAGAAGSATLSAFTSQPTNWSAPASPTDLPGGNTLSPSFVQDFSSGAANKPDRVNYLESGSWEFSLVGMLDYSDVVAAIQDGSLRIGFHMQSLGAGEEFSDGFVNTTTPVPEPGSLLLMGLGIAGVGAVRRRRRRDADQG